MDTTPEVTAIGHLVYPLRGKPALVITPDKVAFQTTPANSPFADKHTGILSAKIDAEGTLQAHVEITDSGDFELFNRCSFRRVSQSQWKDLVQKISYAGLLGGTISNIQISPPEKTEEPFILAYDYTLRDFAEGDKPRFAVPLPAMSIPEVKDEDLSRKTLLWLGYGGEQQYESRIELPKGWSAAPPASISLKESFAEFQGSSEMYEGVLITRRRLLLKASAVTPDQLKSYKVFQKAISDDRDRYIFLKAPAHVGASSSPTTSVYQPEDVASYCKKHPTSSYGAPGTASGVSCLALNQQSRNHPYSLHYPVPISNRLRLCGSYSANTGGISLETGCVALGVPKSGSGALTGPVSYSLVINISR